MSIPKNFGEGFSTTNFILPVSIWVSGKPELFVRLSGFACKAIPTLK
jgi:hypothetical protein